MKTRTFRSDVIGWVWFLAFAAVASTAAWFWVNSEVPIAPVSPEAATLDPHLAIVTYDRITSEGQGRSVSVEALRRHLEALDQAGFEPVRAVDVFNFFYLGQPLPRKSVWITFDGGFLDTYLGAHSELRRMRWPATMSLLTAKQEARDSFYLYWDRVERMTSSGVWDFGSNGHESTSPVAVDPEGASGLFALARMWIPRAERVESPDEFAARIENDLTQSQSMIAEATGMEPLVLSLRVPASADRGEREVLRRIVSGKARELFPLVLSDDRFGTNDRFTSPIQLRRVRVTDETDAEDLLRRLSLPASAEREATLIAESGVAEPGGEGVSIEGSPESGFFIAGSHLAEDWLLNARVRFDAEQFWIVEEAVEPGRYWRWGSDSGGTYAQDFQPDGVRTTLYKSESPLEAGAWHTVEIRKRGQSVVVSVDGEAPVGPIRLALASRGPVGLTVWSNQGLASLEVQDVRFRSQPSVIRNISARPDAVEVAGLRREADLVAGISPEWATLSPGGIEIESMDIPLIRLLEHRYD
jgi:peptidoglycan/xylan/chitin deacetylase (PgdA/CDA1 family)